jgi:hypothetical protein
MMGLSATINRLQCLKRRLGIMMTVPRNSDGCLMSAWKGRLPPDLKCLEGAST